MNEQHDSLGAVSHTAPEQAQLDTNHEASPAKRSRVKRKARPGTVRLTLDVPKPVAQALAHAAKRVGCSVSAVVAWATATALAEHGPDDLKSVLRPSRAPRFEYVLDETALELETKQW